MRRSIVALIIRPQGYVQQVIVGQLRQSIVCDKREWCEAMRPVRIYNPLD
jgi:hypothetical protein